MTKDPVDEMKEQMELCSDAVIKNTKIITPDDIKQDFVLHVAIKNISEFIPIHSRIAAPSEDNTIPRVHTAPTLLGCITGFSLSKYLTTNYIPNSEPNKNKNKNIDGSIKDPYLGGLYIHKIPFDVALKPNTKLVFDSNITDEIWLITYNEKTRKYPANIIGRIIFSQLVIIPRLGKQPSDIQIFLIEISDKESIRLDKNITLTEGYWELHITDNKITEKVIKINKTYFDENHKLKASLLNYTEVMPFTGW